MRKNKQDRTTRAHRRLLVEMAKDQRVVLVEKHPRIWMGLQYVLNSFPRKTLQPRMVETLVQRGYLVRDNRGYYVLTTKGQLVASVEETRSEA